MEYKKVDRSFLDELIGYIVYFQNGLWDLEDKGKLSETQLQCYWDYHFILTNYICFQGDNFPDCSAVNGEKYFDPHPSKMVERLMDEFDASEVQLELWGDLVARKREEFDTRIAEYESIPEKKRDPDKNPWMDDTAVFLIKKYEEEFKKWDAYSYELLCIHCILDIIYSANLE